MTNEVLEQLKLDKARLQKEISIIDKKIEIERLKDIEKKSGITIGTIVKDDKGILYCVNKIGSSFDPKKPWLEGYKMKKDGNFGKQSKFLFSNWEVVSLKK